MDCLSAAAWLGCRIMKNPDRLAFCFIAVCALALPAHGASAGTEIECIKSASFLAPIEAGIDRNYPPDRAVKISHLALDLTPDFKQRTFQGQEIFQFKPNGKPVRELSLDAVDLTILSVTSTEPIQAWQSTADKLIITFTSLVPVEKEVTVTIKYRAQPTKGIYFRTPEMGYKEGDAHLFSNGEPIEARYWYPCFDSPNAKFTSEVTCRVSQGMTAVSNGRLVSEEKDAATGLTVFHWSQEQPHANYLISLAAGYFKKLEEKHNNVPLAYLTPPSEFNEAPAFFRDTKDIMGFYETEIGIPFPWAKYDQICLNDFIWGGMENTSATLLTDGELTTAATENIMDSDSLISHEMAHQWFGDLVTCDDWSDIWLNEGFATYYALLYDGHKNGRDSMLYGLYQNARAIEGVPDDTNAIVQRTYGKPDDVFGRFNYLSYPKGGWVLHMLRSQLGEDLYRRCIKTYLERHQYGNVVTEDLRKVIEDLSGQSYDQFFDQWLYHAHYPELNANYSWDEKNKLAKVSLRQTQKIDQNVLLFNFPLTIRFKGKFGSADRTIQVKDKEAEFYFPLESAPQIVRLDPDYTLLTKTTLSLPNDMLYAQLADKEDVIGRLLAMEQMKDRKDQETVQKLKEVLNNDSFYGARQKAASALRAMHTDDALEALLASTHQPDARARLGVTAGINGFYRETAYASERATLENEKNPIILRVAMDGLGNYARPEVREVLTKFLHSESYRNELADAAIDAMRAQDDPEYITPLLETLRGREADFRSGGFGSGLDTVAYLARNEEKKESVREFLLSYVNHKNERIQVAAIKALGTLGDAKSIAVLQTFANAAKDCPQQEAAQKAVTDLRAGRKPIDDFKNLRQEVLDLEKANREQSKELEDLKKQFEAKEVVPAKSKGKSKPSKKDGN
jgi:aminopeptidase N